MSSIWESKLVSTGREFIDGYLTILFVIFTGILILDVSYVILRAYRDNRVWRRKQVRRRDIYLFLTLALVAFLVVNYPKFNGDITNSAAKKDVDAAVHDFQDPKSVTRRILRNDVDYAKVKHSMDTQIKHIAELQSKGESLPHTLIKNAKQHAKQFLASTHLWEKGKETNNIWDNFKVFVATRSRQWWTQQWYTGYIAWVLFVAIECRQRAIGSFTISAFALLGYIFGLAGMQSLFYTLILLKPKVLKPTAAIANPSVSIAFLGIATLVVAGLPTVLLESFIKSKPGDFHVSQAVAILLPIMAQHWLAHRVGVFDLRHFKTVRKLKRALTFAWFTVSILAAASHCYASYEAYREAGATIWSRLPFFAHSRKQNAKDTGGSIFGALDEHPWIRTMGYDVLLSFLGVCFWAVISDAGARSVIKCSIYPWVDETEAAVGHAIGQVRDTTEEIYDASMNGVKHAFSSAKDTAKKESRDLKRRVSHLQATIGLSDNDIEPDYEQSVAGRRGRSVSSYTPHVRSASGRPTRSVSAGSTRSRSRASVSPVKRSSSRPRNMSLSRRESGVFDDEDQMFFAPNADALSAHAETVGLTLALFAVGGLGMASSAVFGANTVG